MAALRFSSLGSGLTGLVLATLAPFLGALPAPAQTPESCADDAMIVFDASGSMSGNQKLGIAIYAGRQDAADRGGRAGG